MRFWELVDLFRSHEAELRVVLSAREWRVYLSWLDKFDEICRIQDRSKLDEVLPDAVVQTALLRLPHRYEATHGFLRRQSAGVGVKGTEKQSMSALEAYAWLGGSALVECEEYGCYSIEKPKRGNKSE